MTHESQRCYIMASHPFGRFCLHSAENPEYCWTGLQWQPVGANYQVCNFSTYMEARDYAKERGLVVMNHVTQSPSTPGSA